MSLIARIGLLVVVVGCGGGEGAEDAMPCVADCQCASHCCEPLDFFPPIDPIPRFCLPMCGRPPYGICGPNCPCVGGTCDEQACCVLPDGGIDNGFDTACMPFDANF